MQSKTNKKSWDSSDVSSVLDALEKKHPYLKRSSGNVFKVEPLSTGVLMLDNALGVGGWPKGRIIELFGPESSGKSTLALSSATSAQENDILPVYLDFEGSFDTAYAAQLGVDTSEGRFVVERPATLEQGADILEHFIRSDIPILGIVDSVASMLPDSQEQGDIGGTMRIGERARRLGDTLRKLLPQVAQKEATLIYINHLQDVIESRPSPGPKRTTTPGGRALKYYSSVRVELRLRETVKEKVMDPMTGKSVDSTAAMKVQAIVVKNKVSPPWKKATFILRPTCGISYIENVVDVSIARGLVKQRGPRYVWSDNDGVVAVNVSGRRALLDSFLANTDYYDGLKEQLSSLLQGEEGVESIDLVDADDIMNDPSLYGVETVPADDDVDDDDDEEVVEVATVKRGRPRKMSLKD